MSEVPWHSVASRRLPLSWVVSATAFALVVGVAVVAWLATTVDGDDDAAGEGAADVPASPSGETPDSIEKVQLVGLDGGPDRSLGDVLGEQPVVINFFASWCVPCIEEMPDFERVHQDLGDQVAFLGLAVTDRDDQATALVERTGVTYPTYSDPDGDAIWFFEGVVMPTTVFVAPDGEVREVHGGQLSEAELRERIEEHFGPVGTRP
jgi:cytochrome c biogenesis protein CcmG, thiol:disulfide interchange protein DsbE